jgi:hypothetical protein
MWPMRGTNVMGCRMPGFPEIASRTDYTSKILKQCVIPRAYDECFNVASVRSYRSAVNSKVSDTVDEASVSHVEE